MAEGRPKQGRLPFIAAAIRHHSGPVLLVLAAVAAGHVWAIGDGIFFDDRWHQVQLREMPEVNLFLKDLSGVQVEERA